MDHMSASHSLDDLSTGVAALAVHSGNATCDMSAVWHLRKLSLQLDVRVCVSLRQSSNSCLDNTFASAGAPVNNRIHPQNSHCSESTHPCSGPPSWASTGYTYISKYIWISRHSKVDKYMCQCSMNSNASHTIEQASP